MHFNISGADGQLLMYAADAVSPSIKYMCPLHIKTSIENIFPTNFIHAEQFFQVVKFNLEFSLSAKP